MITSKKDYKFYLEQDKIALGIDDKGMKNKVKLLFFPNYVYRFQKSLRRYEYVTNCKLSIINKIIAKKKFENLSVKLGFTIAINVFGPGLAIVHFGSIVVSRHAKIGANCRINVGANIGASNGDTKAPQIGNNVYIGPGAKLYGGITIADNCAIGANSVVNKSFDNPNMMIAGMPAKEIKQIEIRNIIKHIK